MIIIGYPGVGKTYNCAKRDKFIDLESSSFSQVIRSKKWLKIYCNAAMQLSEQGYVVCISSHKGIIPYLLNHNFPKNKIIMVYPCPGGQIMKKFWPLKLYGRFKETNSDKDYRAYIRARDNYVNDVHTLHKWSKVVGSIIIPDIDFNYDELWDVIDQTVAAVEGE